MKGLEKNCMGRGQTNKQINRHTDIATTRKNRPKGRFFENCFIQEDNQAQSYIGWTERGDVEQFENMSKNEEQKYIQVPNDLYIIKLTETNNFNLFFVILS